MRLPGRAKWRGHYAAGEILLTSMDRDGTRIGFDLALTRAICEAVDIPIASGGWQSCSTGGWRGGRHGGCGTGRKAYFTLPSTA